MVQYLACIVEKWPGRCLFYNLAQGVVLVLGVGYQSVEVVDIGLQVFAVVIFYGCLTDDGCQGARGVAERRHLKAGACCCGVCTHNFIVWI